MAEIEALGVQALGVPTDVSRADDVKRMVQQTIARFGKIDILELFDLPIDQNALYN